MAAPLREFVWSPDEARLERANLTRLMRRFGFERYARAAPDLDRRARAVLARGRRRPRARVHAPVAPRARHLARDRVGDVVRRRAGERRAELRAPLGGSEAPRDGGRVPRRGRHAARAHVVRALTRDDAARRGTRRARRRAGRPRRDLHADVPGSCGRVARVRARRGRPGAGLLRVRRAGRAPAARGVGGEGRDLRRLVNAPGPADGDARDPRRGRRRPARDRLGARSRSRGRSSSAVSPGSCRRSRSTRSTRTC